MYKFENFECCMTVYGTYKLKSNHRGAWVTHTVECLTLNLDSSHALGVVRWSPTEGSTFSVDSVRLRFFSSPSASPHPFSCARVLALSLCLSQNK